MDRLRRITRDFLTFQAHTWREILRSVVEHICWLRGECLIIRGALMDIEKKGPALVSGLRFGFSTNFFSNIFLHWPVFAL